MVGLNSHLMVGSSRLVTAEKKKNRNREWKHGAEEVISVTAQKNEKMKT